MNGPEHHEEITNDIDEHKSYCSRYSSFYHAGSRPRCTTFVQLGYSLWTLCVRVVNTAGGISVVRTRRHLHHNATCPSADKIRYAWCFRSNTTSEHTVYDTVNITVGA